MRKRHLDCLRTSISYDLSANMAKDYGPAGDPAFTGGRIRVGENYDGVMQVTYKGVQY